MLSWTKRSLLPLGWLGAVALASSCGARSELLIPEIDFCTTFTSVAQPTQLDLFLLLDSSGSMEIPINDTMGAPTKWQEVTAAVEAFGVDPVLQGTGAAVSFFPETREDVPNFCQSDNACGETGACFMDIGVCMPSFEALCLDAQDCEDEELPGDTCEPLGQCQGVDNLCLLGGPDDFCEGLPCVDVGLCSNRTVCDSSAYTFGVPMTLPNSANGLIAAMLGRELGGGTPTWPAVEGAIDSAASWSEQNPERRGVVVLATDGLPAACEPSVTPVLPDEFPVDNTVAAIAAGAEQGVATFVIGVFDATDPDEVQDATFNLNAIAAAGSDQPAFVVTTDQNIEQRVLDALLEVQAQATSCVYAVPWQPPDNNNTFEVELTKDNESMVVPKLPVAGACGVSDGFYFVTPPSTTALSVQIGLCPTTCERFEGQPDEVRLHARCD